MTVAESYSVTVPLLGSPAESQPNFWWRFIHAFAFLLGGTTFIAGTVALFYPGWETASAALYTLGSIGFFAVDAQELATLGCSGALQANIALSCVGSALYIIGSVGFFPQLNIPLVGIWGFILGSAVIGCSQFWKTHRIGSSEKGLFSLATLWKEKEAFTAAGVELSAGLGAWCFFFGTGLYLQGPLEGADSVLALVLQIWVLGSAWFTLGGCFVAYRHFVMHVI